MSDAMRIKGIYACIAVSDFTAGVDFYIKLMGREPDDRPMPDMVQWRRDGGLQIWHDPTHAGHSRTTIVVIQMQAERDRLQSLGITLGPDLAGDWGIVAQLSDPDGNQITLAEPPKGFAG